MNAIHRLAHSLKSACTAFFRHDLALKRADSGVHIVLQQRPPPVKAKPKSTKSRSALSDRDNEELALIRKQLSALLDDMPETRATMRHLGFVEQALQKKGLRALHKLPLEVLQRGLDQLENLVTNWSPEGLANLRSKMAVAIIDRENMDPDAEADAYRTSAVLDHSPQPTLPPPPTRTDDDALAAAYAGLADLAPAKIETQGELASLATRRMAREASRGQGAAEAVKIELRQLQD